MISYLKKEKVMTIALILAIVSSFFIRPDHKYLEYIDWRVLALLFCLMVAVRGFQELGLFSMLVQICTRRIGNLRRMVAMLVLICFFSSMLITNDVSLITFVPFSILMLRTVKQEKYMIITIVLQTIAANLGSMFTPIGNPQNLYLYSISEMSITEFFSTMWFVTLASFVLLVVSVWITIPALPIEGRGMEETTEDEANIAGGTVQWILFSFLFILDLMVVFRVLHWEIAFLMTIVGVFMIGKKAILRKVDYALLMTFAGFFIFIGNIGRIPAICDVIENLLTGREILMAVIFSQFMSNVPAAILLSGFTDQYAALMIGVNLGGLGTLIASMASLISFKLYAKEEDARKGTYLKEFTIWSIIGLIVLGGLVWIIKMF